MDQGVYLKVVFTDLLATLILIDKSLRDLSAKYNYQCYHIMSSDPSWEKDGDIYVNIFFPIDGKYYEDLEEVEKVLKLKVFW